MRVSLIPSDHLLLIAREWVFGRNNVNTTTEHVLKVLGASDCDESRWLLSKLRNAPEFGHTYEKHAWMRNLLHKEDTPWANFYRGVIMGERGLSDIRRSAEAGFASAMTTLSWRLRQTNSSESVAWLQKAVALDCPNAQFLSSSYNNFPLIHAAATNGCEIAMLHCVTEFSHKMSPAETAQMFARYVLYTGQKNAYAYHYARTTGTRFVVGREFYGYNEFWDTNRHPDASLLECISVYLKATRNARQAALHTVLILTRVIGIKDVARLIGKMVYKTREDDPDKWIF